MTESRRNPLRHHLGVLFYKAAYALDRHVLNELDRVRAQNHVIEGSVQQIASELTIEREGVAALHDRIDALYDRIGHEPDAAGLLTHAQGPEGPAAQAGLWFNPPVPVAYRDGDVNVLLVNERIVEIPFVFGELLTRVPAPARVADVGGAESTVALSLASLGYEVTVVDPRGYRLEHPRLSVVEAEIDDTDLPHGGFDAAICLSSVEHFGLSHYTGEGSDRRKDLEATRRLRSLVAPGGHLIITVPMGKPSVNDFERVYDLAGVHELTAGWEIERFDAVWRRDPHTWEAGPVDDGSAERGVALISARNP
jgi:SAM-dependent methyltransferase